jgi:hypothetical protein
MDCNLLCEYTMGEKSKPTVHRNPEDLQDSGADIRSLG